MRQSEYMEKMLRDDDSLGSAKLIALYESLAASPARC
jgi:hypothetical protein